MSRSIPVYIGIYLLILGCSSSPSLTAPLTAPYAPLTPIQAGVGIGTTIEDLIEDPETDKQEASVLEMASDLLNLPWRVAVNQVAIAGGFLWTLADMPFHGYEKGTYDKRVDTILQYLPHDSAMPAQ